MNRAFHIGGLVLVGMSLCMFALSAPPWLFLLVGGVFSGVLLLLKRKYTVPLWCGAIAVTLLLGGGRLWLYQFRTPDVSPFVGKEQILEGFVVGQSRSDTSLALEMLLTENSPAGLAGQPFTLRTSLTSDIKVGEIISFAAKPEAVPVTELQGGGSRLQGYVFAEPLVVGENMRHPQVVLENIRTEIASRIFMMLPTQEGRIAGALVTGVRSRISSDTRLLFQTAGLSHFLAMSGQHLSIFIGILSVLLEPLIPWRKLRIAAELLVILGFVAVSGFSPSMLRAGLMASVARLGLLMGRYADGLNSLGFAAVLLLLWNPAISYSVSFLLSYLSTMGILAFHESISNFLGRIFLGRDYFQLKDERPKVASFVSAMSVTPAALSLTLPLTGWYFGTITPWAILTNPLAYLPMLGALFFAILAVPAVFLPFQILGKLLLTVSGVCIRTLMLLGKGVGMLPFASVTVDSLEIVFWEIVLIGCLIVLWLRREKMLAFLFSIGLSACALVTVLLSAPNLWRPAVTLLAPEYASYCLLIYGREAVIVGAPENLREASYLSELLRSEKISSIPLWITPKALAPHDDIPLHISSVTPTKHLLSLEDDRNFEALVFSGVTLGKDGSDGVWLDMDGLRAVKTFRQRSANAHILINSRNQIITEEQLPMKIYTQNDVPAISLILTGKDGAAS